MWRKRSACSLIAATTLGCECPVVTTAMPAVKSRNRLPSTSVTQQPCPRSMTKGYERVKLGDMALASRAMSSAALGPGSGVLMSGFTRGKLTERPPHSMRWWRRSSAEGTHNGRDGEDEEGQSRLFGSPFHPRRPAGDHRDLQLG